MINRLALGTAQFGYDYGIANKRGRIPEGEVLNILQYASEAGMDTLDTAYSYGTSESVIGSFISSHGNEKFKIISKLPDLGKAGIPEAEKFFSETLARLGQKRIYGYLLHSFGNIISHKGLWGEMKALKRKGLAEKIGVSLYKTEELDYLLEEGIDFDIVQFPYNIFDQRFKEYFNILKKKGTEIYTRSVFLQGLFFMGMDEIEKKFISARSNMEKLRSIAAKNEIPLNFLCLCFVLLNPFIDKVVIGIDSLDHLKQNIDSLEYCSKVKYIYGILEGLNFHDENIILPYNWKKG